MLSDFLDGAHAVVVVEDGAIAFDLAESKYAVSGEYNKCLLHVWSSERNFVRRVPDAEVKGTTLRTGAAHGAESACRLRASSAPGDGEKFSRMDRGPAHHQRRS